MALSGSGCHTKGGGDDLFTVALDDEVATLLVGWSKFESEPELGPAGGRNLKPREKLDVPKGSSAFDCARAFTIETADLYFEIIVAWEGGGAWGARVRPCVSRRANTMALGLVLLL